MRDVGVGFSFCGIHTDDLNVMLGNNENAMHAMSADLTYDSETVDGYDGAYPTGSQAKPLEFTINMFCEDFTDRDLARVAECFRRDAYGPLIFDHRPYKYYNVRVTSGITPPPYVRYDRNTNMFLYSGTISVKLTAFTPYAYAVDEVVTAYPDVGNMLNTVNSGSGIIETALRPPKQFATLHGTNSHLMLNQGNAPAKCDVIITGVDMHDGVLFENEATGDSFLVVAPDNAAHTYIVSAFYGRTVEVVGEEQKMADDVKGGGFITLRPCGLSYRDITVVASGSSNEVTVDCDTEYSMVHKHIYINGSWHNITGITEDTLVLEDVVASGTYTDAVIVGMNKLTVSCGIATINALQYSYKDTFY